MKANIGEIKESGKSQVLHGDHHIITSYPVKDGQKNLVAGSCMKLVAGKIEHLASATEQTICILLEDIADGATDEVAAVVIHGAVRKEKVVFSDANTEITSAGIEVLRKVALYAI